MPLRRNGDGVVDDNRVMTEQERAEAFRAFHAEHLRKQTRFQEQIRNYVAIWFWLSVAGALVLVVAMTLSSSSGY